MQELANDPKVQGLLEKIDAKFERAGLWSPWAALPQGAPPALPIQPELLDLFLPMLTAVGYTSSRAGGEGGGDSSGVILSPCMGQRV